MFYSKLKVASLVLSTLLVTSLAAKETPRYVGVKKCKICHNRKNEVKQYDIWKSTAHSKAYETLATDSAKQLAAKAGVKGDPQKAPECLECHVTGFGEDSTMFGKSFVVEDGVQCESCHGPGSQYKSTKIMSRKKYAEQRETQHQLAVEAGLIIPDEKTCLKCHNKRSPAFKGFDYKTYYAKIKHEYER